MKVQTYVKEITVADVEKVYRGEVGCACGCGGDYITVAEATEEQMKEVNKYIKYINARLKDAEVWGGGIAVSNPSYTKITRLYFVDDVLYYKNCWNNLDRITGKRGE